jgi:hypothetical protein
MNSDKPISDFGFRISDLERTLLAVFLLVGIAGCSKDYEQKKLGTDSPQAAQVRAMVQSLRQAGEKGLLDVMKQQSAGSLSEPQTESLQASLRELAAAESAELDRIDRFGPEVYRATFTLASAGKTRPVALLLVSKANQLRWAGRN